MGGLRAVVLGLAAVLAGCSAIAAVDPARDAGTGPLGFSGACEGCVVQSCLPAANRCSADAACAPLGRCLAGLQPNDVAGRGACEAASPGALGSESFRALDDCLRSTCADPCLGRGGLFPTYSDACQSCLQQPSTCGEPIAACVHDRACEAAYRSCFGSPDGVDPTHAFGCFYAPANESNPVDAVQACLSRCPTICPPGEDWRCAGRYVWPIAARSPTARVRSEVTVFGFGGNRPASGVALDVCAPLLAPCQPILQGSVDDDSRLDVAVPTDLVLGGGFRGYFRFGARPAATEVRPTLLFGGLPILEDLDIESPVLLFAPADVAALAGLLGVRLTSGKGILAIIFFDCTMLPATDVAAELSPNAIFAGPDPAHSTQLVNMSGLGDGSLRGTLFVNVNEGCVEIAGRAGGQVTHRLRVHVQADALTYAFAWPLTESGQSTFECALP